MVDFNDTALFLLNGNWLVGLSLLILSFCGAALPQWLFPVRGPWLAYLLRGLGVFLLLPVPFTALAMIVAVALTGLAIVVAAAARIAGHVEAGVTGRDSSRSVP